MKEAYTQGLESEEDGDCVGDQIKPRDVGHNIYILAHQVIEEPELLLLSVTEPLLRFLSVCLTLCSPQGPLLQELALVCVSLLECVVCAK